MLVIATTRELARVVELANCLWPGGDGEEMAKEFREALSSDTARIALWMEAGEAAGFAQGSLRTDYVEGASTRPVGYLEGVYVSPAWRGRGIARALVGALEAWAREKGCVEFASDCELRNTASARFHEKLGFAEANRVICFHKNLARPPVYPEAR